MSRLLIVILVANLLYLLPATGAPDSEKVAPRVWEDTAKGGRAHFLVYLAEQADTRGKVGRKSDRRERGRAVFNALRQTAERTQPGLRALLDQNHSTYRSFWVVNMIAVEGNRGLVEALAARPDVKAIESDRVFPVPVERAYATESAIVATPLAVTNIPAGLGKIGATNLWNLGYTGQNIVYGNADTGVQWDHPALKAHYRGWNGTDANHNYNWWDAIHEDYSGNLTNILGFNLQAPGDDQGHGTHTTGIGVGGDGAGNQIGVAPGAKFICCRNMDENYGRPSTYIECMQFFLAPTDLSGNNPDPDRRADVVGNSYGCPPDELCAPNSLHTALENMRAAGIFMSVAAGNAGPNCGTINDPPALDAASITVGATSAADAIANFSSRGPVTIDGSNRPKPELVAPGVSVYSAYPPDSYLSLSGTSMAAPHVAGAVALLWSAFPQVRGNVDYTLSVLEQSAVHLTTNQGCGGDNSSSVPNHVFGYGRIDVLAAFHFIADHPALELKLEGNSLTVSWPSPSATFRLQQSTDRLTWSDVEQATVDNGTVRSVTISSPGQTLFFRLTR